MALRMYPFSDVWELEGYNGSLKSAVSRSPHIGLPFAASRCEMRKELGIGGRTFKRSWSRIQPKATAM
eukprot:4506746-Karenia_brevis.AAC.1